MPPTYDHTAILPERTTHRSDQSIMTESHVGIMSWATAIECVGRYFELEDASDSYGPSTPKASDDEITTPHAIISRTTQHLGKIGIIASTSDRPVIDAPEADFPLLLCLSDGTALFLAQKTSSGFEAWCNDHDKALLRPSDIEALPLVQAFSLSQQKSSVPTRSLHLRGLMQSEAFLEPRYLLHPDRIQYVLIVCSAGLQLLAVGTAAFLLILIVDRFILPDVAGSTIAFSSAATALGLVLATSRLLQRVQVGWLASRFTSSLTDLLFDSFLKTPLGTRHSTLKDLPKTLTALDRLRLMANTDALHTLPDALLAIGCILFLFLIDNQLAWPALIGLAALHVTSAAMYYPLKKASDALISQMAAENSLIEETVYALETIRLSQSEAFVQGLWHQTRKKAAKAHLWFSVLSETMTILSLVIGIGSLIYLLSAGIPQVINQTLTVGELLSLFLLAGSGFMYAHRFVSAQSNVQLVFAAIRGLEPLVQVKPHTAASDTDNQTALEGPYDIDIAELTFAYSSPGPTVFDGLNLTIKQGEKVAILGKIGSGKTSLGRILAAVYKGSHGTYHLAGRDTAILSGEQVRSVLRVVGQDTSLFKGTLRSNVTMGRKGVADQRLFDVLKMTGADALLHGHPFGLDLPIEDFGRNLSSGQRQAVVMARALLEPPQILFLDEPTGNMDSRSEKNFVRQLRNIVGPDQTLILTTHRTMPLALVDRLIILGDGKVLADGPKEKVIDLITG